MSTLARLLDEEKTLIERFLAVLADEEASLRTGQSDALEAIGIQKTALVDALNAVESRRIALLGKPVGETGKAGMTHWLAAHPAEQAATGLWNRILELAAEAKRQHELNGQLIAMHLKRTSEVLAVLTQRQQASGLYGSDGQATPGSGSRIIDSA